MHRTGSPLPGRPEDVEQGHGALPRHRSMPGLAPILWIGIALSLPGCSTLPFTSQQGTGAGPSLTLATVDHVSKRNDELRAQLEQELAERVAAEVAAAREEDRARLDALEASLEARREEIAALAEQLDRNDRNLTGLATLVSNQFELLAADSAEMRRVAVQLESEIGALPRKTLRELGRAIELHLDTEPASQPPPSRALRPDPSARRSQSIEPVDPPGPDPATSRAGPSSAPGQPSGGTGSGAAGL